MPEQYMLPFGNFVMLRTVGGHLQSTAMQHSGAKLAILCTGTSIWVTAASIRRRGLTRWQVLRKGAGVGHPVSTGGRLAASTVRLSTISLTKIRLSVSPLPTLLLLALRRTVGRDPAGAAPRRHWPWAIRKVPYRYRAVAAGRLAAPIPVRVFLVSV